MIAFSEQQFLGPVAALVLALAFMGILIKFVAGLLKDFKDATAEVKTICREMCEAFKSEAKEWRAEAADCKEHNQKLVELFMEQQKSNVR